MKLDCDVLVVGAGIVGAACAFRLAEGGLSTIVIDSAGAPATGSTGRSAAGVRVQFSSKANVELSWQSIKEYRAFGELYGVDSGYQPIGYLLLVAAEAWQGHLASVDLQHSLGAPVEVLTSSEAQSHVPFEQSAIRGATYGPADGVIDPHAVTFAYLQMAAGHGAALLLDAPLTHATRSGTRWNVDTPRGSITATHVVNATGAWAGVVGKRAGLSIPVRPSRRMVFATSPIADVVPMPLTIDLGTGFYLRSEGSRILFGRSNPDEAEGFVEGMDWAWLEPTLAVGLKRFPWLEHASLDRKASWWGYYELSPDHNAILGTMPDAPGWINACGFSGHGVQQAAAVATVVREEVLLGRARSINIDSLRIERFQNGDLKHERNVV